MNITRENLSDSMQTLFEKKKDWLKVYKTAKKSQIHFFESLFVYNLIRKQIDIKDFEVVYKEIVKKSDIDNLRDIYEPFLKNDIDLDISKYLAQDRYNNNFPDWQNMVYIFLTKENYQIALEPTSVEYLKVMFTSLDSSNFKALANGGLMRFFYEMTPNIAALKPILQAVQNKTDYQNEIVNSLLSAISSMSYQLPEKTNKSSYKALVESIPNIQSHFENNVVKAKTDELGLEIDSSLMNFLNACQVNVAEMINKKYQESYESLLKNPVNVSNKPIQFQAYYKEEPFVKLVISISSSMEVCYRENSPLDISKIDINQPAYKNFVYLKTLEMKLKNDEPIKASLNLCNYINDVHKKEKVMPSIGNFLDLEMMSSKLMYNRLESNLENKSVTAKKTKI